MNAEDDPLRNASVGCLWPVVRNFLLTGVSFIAAAVLGFIANSFWVFLGTMIVLTLVHGSIWRRYWKPREDVASARFWRIR
jgi:hypothetical protein